MHRRIFRLPVAHCPLTSRASGFTVAVTRSGDRDVETVRQPDINVEKRRERSGLYNRSSTTSKSESRTRGERLLVTHIGKRPMSSIACPVMRTRCYQLISSAFGLKRNPPDRQARRVGPLPGKLHLRRVAHIVASIRAKRSNGAGRASGCE